MSKFSDGCEAGWDAFVDVMHGENLIDAMNGVVERLRDNDDEEDEYIDIDYIDEDDE